MKVIASRSQNGVSTPSVDRQQFVDLKTASQIVAKIVACAQLCIFSGLKLLRIPPPEERCYIPSHRILSWAPSLYTHSSIIPKKILTHHGLKQFFAKYSFKAPGVQIRWNICKFCIIYWKKVFLWFWFFNSVLLFDEKKLQDFCRK